MNAVSGRMTLKNTSLATSSVFSTVLVTRVEAYLLGRDKTINYLSSWSCDGIIKIQFVELQIKMRVQKRERDQRFEAGDLSGDQSS